MSTKATTTTTTTTRKGAKAKATTAPAVEATTAPTVEALAPVGLLARAAATTDEQRTAAARAALAAIGVEVPADYIAPTGGYNAGVVTPATRDNGFRAAREAHAARLGRRTLGREVLALCWHRPVSVVWHAEANAIAVNADGTVGDLPGYLADLAAVTAEQAASADAARKAK